METINIKTIEVMLKACQLLGSAKTTNEVEALFITLSAIVAEEHPDRVMDYLNGLYTLQQQNKLDLGISIQTCIQKQ